METMSLSMIGLIGEGSIYSTIHSAIEKSGYHVTPLSLKASGEELTSCSLVVYCSDIWTPEMIDSINQRCIEAQVILLPVYTQFDRGIVGPCVLPERSGCIHCAQVRTLSALSKEEERELYRQQLFGERTLRVKQPWLTSASLRLLALLFMEEASRYLTASEPLQLPNDLLTLSLETLECRRRRFLPVPECPYCFQLPEDSASQAQLLLQSRPKPGPFTYRTRHLKGQTESLFQAYVDEQTGMIPSVTVSQGNWFPCVISKINIHHGHKVSTVTGMGCSLHMEQNKGISLVEALERYAGLYPRGKRTVVRGSYNQLREQALDPTTLGLHTPEQYARMESLFVPYDHDLVCDWVWGYSFQQQRPILVPECCAYYGFFKPKGREKSFFVYEISNGCAIGSNLEEAIFHGMMEIVERDSFLLTWYARLPLPRIDPYSASDPAIRLLLKHIEYHSGYSIHVFDATLDHAVPSLWVLAVDEQKRVNMARARCGGGVHPHPEHALYRALHEMAAGLSSTSSSLYRHQREHALEMLADADKVTSMADHVTLYFLPEAFERLNFFYRSQALQTFQQAFPAFYQQHPARMDLRDDLTSLLEYYLKRGMDIIVVDQTAPEHMPLDFHCVKVLMPGMLPMTFGQRNRRFTGFQRLHQLPYTLGYADHPLTEEECNPFPHPFP